VTHARSPAGIQSKKVCVIYDPATGRIRHRHNVITFAGGREPTLDQIATDALHALKSPPIRRVVNSMCSMWTMTRLIRASGIGSIPIARHSSPTARSQGCVRVMDQGPLRPAGEWGGGERGEAVVVVFQKSIAPDTRPCASPRSGWAIVRRK
jgi:hypothetical protein